MNAKIKEKKIAVNNKNSQKNYVFAVGRRKASTAKIRLYKKDTEILGGILVKTGEIVINGKPVIEYFDKNLERICKSPLVVTGNENRFAVSIVANGGGKMGQLDAVVLAMARALDKVNKEKFHSALKKKEMLTRDPRVRQRRKVGMGGKSRRKKQSPKR